MKIEDAPAELLKEDQSASKLVQSIVSDQSRNSRSAFSNSIDHELRLGIEPGLI